MYIYMFLCIHKSLRRPGVFKYYAWSATVLQTLLVHVMTMRCPWIPIWKPLAAFDGPWFPFVNAWAFCVWTHDVIICPLCYELAICEAVLERIPSRGCQYQASRFPFASGDIDMTCFVFLPNPTLTDGRRRLIRVWNLSDNIDTA